MTALASAISLLTTERPDNPPEGFRTLPTGTGFNQLLGPIYGHMNDGKLTLGMRIGNRHINPHQTCHGGVLACFADMQVYVSQQESHLKHVLLPTINMTIDYISPAVLGDWLEGRTTLIRATNSTLFQQTLAVVGDRPVFRSSCIYKVSKHLAPEGSTLGDLFADQQE